MISVHYDTLATVEKLEGMLGRIRIREERKIQRARELLRDRLNYRRIIQRLGLK
jgi:BioD-like phosphotransacetylase family protein